jgi:hypothetical protein
METFKLWGTKVVPPEPWLSHNSQYFQMWRSAEVLEGMVFARCTKCNLPFSIFGELVQKQLICPYCGKAAAYEEDQEKFLTVVLKELLQIKEKKKRLGQL